MVPNSQVMQAVEALDYRVTVGDVATQSGLDVQTVERELLALASVGGGHLQASTAGELAYAFPQNFRAILRQKSRQLRRREFWQKVGSILFAGIRLSFGILLLISIVLVYVAILVAVISASSQKDGSSNNRRRSSSYNNFYFDIRPFWYLFFNLRRQTQARWHRAQTAQPANNSPLNFLEAVYSFLFGDGDPNADLEEKRWQLIGGAIRANDGVAIAEQVAPYLDELGTGDTLEYEDYMLPVLLRFNGVPEVSPRGEMIYRFPELQVVAEERQSRTLPQFLQASLQKFSIASAQQIMLAIVLGVANLIGIAILGSLLGDVDIVGQLGGFYGFVSSIYWLLVVYGVAFLTIPIGRYFWIQRQNQSIQAGNTARQDRAAQLANAEDGGLQQKLNFARKFSRSTTIADDDILYTSEQDLAAQELDRLQQADEP
ncbi:MAG: hypothetical protein AAFY11_06450 [Cyanobacteria bacterium J06641_5]